MTVALTTAERADLALLIASLSLLLALVALFWEWLHYRLEGPRVAVRLVAGIATETGHLIRRNPGRHHKPSSDIEDLIRGRPWIELAIITVTNYGRTPVSVSEIALDFGRRSWWRFWWRHTVVGVPIEIFEGAGASSTYRLEPTDSVTVIYDLWTLVNESRTDRSKTLKVRGSVLPAGRRNRRRRSPRRGNWTISPGQESIWSGGPDHPQLKPFRAVWRAVAFTHPKEIYDAWISVSALLIDPKSKPSEFINPDAEPTSVQDIADALQPPLDAIEATMAAGRIRMAMIPPNP